MYGPIEKGHMNAQQPVSGFSPWWNEQCGPRNSQGQSKKQWRKKLDKGK